MMSLVLLAIDSSPPDQNSWIGIVGFLVLAASLIYLQLKLLKFVFGSNRRPRKPEVRYVFLDSNQKIIGEYHSNQLHRRPSNFR